MNEWTSVAVTVVVARILCFSLLAEVSPVRQWFFFQFFVPLKQAEKEKSEALDKYLRIGIILPSLLYGHLF